VHAPQAVRGVGVEGPVHQIVAHLAVTGSGAATTAAVVDPHRPTEAHQTPGGRPGDALPAAQAQLLADSGHPVAVARPLPDVEHDVGPKGLGPLAIGDRVVLALVV